MSLFSQPYTSLFDRSRLIERRGEAANRFLVGSPSVEDLRLLGYTQYCGSTSDCGYGSQCVDGLCRPIGAGNTQYGEKGCSSGPSSSPPVTLNCINCGYDSEKSCAGIRTCKFTPYGVTCQCGGSGGGGGTPGPGDGEEGKPCNKYCTTEYSSYGTYGPGCGDNNTCSECYSCDGGDDNNGNCAKKSRDDGAPCHCDPEEGESCTPRTGEPLTCCSYQDTCIGRIDQPYCHPTYRTFYSRCYNPDYPQCQPPFSDEPGCNKCTNGYVTWNKNQDEPVLLEEDEIPCATEGRSCPENKQECVDPISGNCICRECCPAYDNNQIENDETGDVVTMLICCKNTCPEDPNGKCNDSLECSEGKCCVNNKCEDCPSPILYARYTGTVYNNGYYEPPYTLEVETGWIDVSGGKYLGLVPKDDPECYEPLYGGPWSGTGALVHKATPINTCGIAGYQATGLALWYSNGAIAAKVVGVNYLWYYPSTEYLLYEFNGYYEFSYDRVNVIGQIEG